MFRRNSSRSRLTKDSMPRKTKIPVFKSDRAARVGLPYQRFIRLTLEGALSAAK